jgi:hypothetical protein
MIIDDSPNLGVLILSLYIIKNENRFYHNYPGHIYHLFYGGAYPFQYWKEWQTQNAQIYRR